MKTGSHMILFPCRWEVTWYHYSTRNRHHSVKILWCRIILYNYLECPILSGELLVIGNLVLPEYSLLSILLKSVEAHAMHLHIVQHSFSLVCAGLAAVFLWRLVWGGQRWTPSVVWRQPYRLAGWGKREGRGRGGRGGEEEDLMRGHRGLMFPISVSVTLHWGWPLCVQSITIMWPRPQASYELQPERTL